MMSRFTEKAQEALQRAQQIMHAKQHTQLNVEHIFLALLQQRDNLCRQIITRLDGDLPVMMDKLEDALRNLPGSDAVERLSPGYITMRANQVLQGAVEE